MQPVKKNLHWAVFFSRARQKAVSAMWQTENDEPRSSKETVAAANTSSLSDVTF